MSQQSCLPLPSRRDRRKMMQKLNTNKGKKNNNDVDEHNEIENYIPISRRMDIDDEHFQEMSAMEYLAQVHAEAESISLINVCPSSTLKKSTNNNGGKDVSKVKEEKYTTFKAAPPIDGTSASLHHLLSHRTTLPPCPSFNDSSSNNSRRLMPVSKDAWIDSVLSDFSELRLYLHKCESAGIGTKRVIQNLPTLKDRAGWHEFCLGKEESVGNMNDYFQDDEDEDEDEDDDEEYDEEDYEDEDKNNMETIASSKSKSSTKNNKVSNEIIQKGHPPTVQLLLQMDQVMTRKVLSHHIYFLMEKWEASSSRMLWIYALLANLKKPLHRDDLASLRSLLMECCVRRWNLLKQSEKNDGSSNSGGMDMDCNRMTVIGLGNSCCIQGLNLIICIVGIYFEQGKREEIMGR